MIIIKIVILIVIDSYIIKSKDNDNDDENNAQNKQKTNTITTIKTLITGKTLTGEEREKKYLFITSKLSKDYLV